MKKYTYPAIFDPENGGYNISFPDLPGCLTCGETLDDALHMAKDVLTGFLEWLKEDGEAFPDASDPSKIKTSEGSIVSLITAWIHPVLPLDA